MTPTSAPETSVPSNDAALADAAFDLAFKDIDPVENPPSAPVSQAPPIAPEPPVTQPEPPPVAEAPKDETVDPLDAPPTDAAPPVKPTSKDLRTQLEQRNKAFKDLEVAAAQKELELENIRKETEDLRKQLEVKASFVPEKIDFSQHESVKAHRDLMERDINAVSLSLGKEGKILKQNFNEWFKLYYSGTKQAGEQGDEVLNKLNETLETELGENGRMHAMSLMGRVAPGYEAAVAEMRKLEADSHNIRTRQTVEKYSATAKEISDVLAPMGDLPPEVIATKPHDPATYIAKLVSSDPAWAARSLQVKKEIAEVLSGPKPISPEERAKLEANDTGGLSKIEEDMQKTHSQKRNLTARRLYQAMMILPNLPSMLEELEGLRAGREAEDSEIAALDSVPEAKVVQMPSQAKKDISVEAAAKMVDDIFAGNFREA
jgi:hypothetical protein